MLYARRSEGRHGSMRESPCFRRRCRGGVASFRRSRSVVSGVDYLGVLMLRGLMTQRLGGLALGRQRLVVDSRPSGRVANGRAAGWFKDFLRAR